ncbi:helix-turn-helix transcriptional regulator [Nocardioides sp. zg-536]|uniref:Helix-turn-helix transcriptional regulator n=1 Tax=Nocardioides faecalis TaxID=2803858 RepID=A0A938Y3U2_9ACTN|nr:helix-turn-helix transcriptional regulator [Nocardioides faecalis]MBM9458759.1 helix-turn-helix transcriptional regulator [Nocardioides faecalis]QVI60177.1 helix-turn-helix transcriptional regulator [Nocardioides faecalis]
MTSPKTGDIELGRTIAARREELGMSRKELAEATNLSYPYIAQIETGYRLPSSRHQVPIAKALGLSLDELFRTEGELAPARTRKPERRRRSSLEEVVATATAEIESLPPAVRLEALSRIQLNVMTGVTEAQALRKEQP